MESTATISPGVFLIVVAIAVLIALAAGYFARLYEERSKPEAHPIETRLAEASKTETKPALSDEHTALKVTLDRNLAWHLEVDGKRIAPDELTAEQRARLVNIIVNIRPWIDGKAVAAPVSPPAPAPPPKPAAEMPTAAAMPTNPHPHAEEGANKSRISIGRGFRSLLSNELKVMEQNKPPSIIAMIDDFLQKRLENSPLAEREIHLEESSLGEVIVFVGKTQYAGVEAVPDPEIQAIIKAAIKDWEKSA